MANQYNFDSDEESVEKNTPQEVVHKNITNQNATLETFSDTDIDINMESDTIKNGYVVSFINFHIH